MDQSGSVTDDVMRSLLESSSDLDMEMTNDFLMADLDPSNLSTSSTDPVDTQFTEAEKLISDMRTCLSTLMALFLKHNMTFSALEGTAGLINRSPAMKIPETKYLLMKNFQSDFPIVFHIYCENCSRYERNDGKKSSIILCNGCDSQLWAVQENFFVCFNIEVQLKKIVRKYWKQIAQYQKDTIQSNGKSDITDITNGRILKRILERNIMVLSLTLNTDGVPVFESRKKSLWPIQISLNFLPPDLRFQLRNILLAALYFGEKKPNTNMYFQPLREELIRLEQNPLTVNIDGQEHAFEVFVTHCTLDLPAVSMVQCIKQFNGTDACGYCYHPGVSIKNFKGKGSTIRYIWRGKDEPLRDHNKTKEHMIAVSRLPEDLWEPIQGVTDISVMLDFKEFDIVNGFTIDYMHGLGVVKTMLGLWLDKMNKKQTFYMKAKTREILDRRLLSIKPCTFINRKPQKLSNRAMFKASEYKYLLLYYLPIILVGLLPSSFVAHFRLLSSAIYLLLNSNITDSDLNCADLKLRRFVEDFPVLYGKSRATMNIHRLCHLVENVRNNGPLWANSMFHFESNNATLLKYVTGTKDVLELISTKYSLASMISPKNEGEVHDSENQHDTITKNPKTFLISHPISTVLTELGIDINIDEFQTYLTQKIQNILYTSVNYTRQKNSIDYFVRFQSVYFGKVHFFFKFYGVNFTVIEQFSVKANVDQFIIFNSNTKMVAVESHVIDEKLIYFEINNVSYAVPRPNLFEKE